MELNIDKEYQRLFFLGDIHGNFAHVSYLQRCYAIRHAIIFQVGDFGIGFEGQKEDRELAKLSEHLVSKDCLLVAIRGNHDDRSKFNNQYVKPNILLLADFTVLNININGIEKRILGIGGAVSIDRVFRQVKKWKWFPDEPVNMQLAPEFLAQFQNIDYLVTHTAMENVEPYNFNQLVYQFAQDDPNLLEDLRVERRRFTTMLKCISENNSDTLVEHFYGHFHFSATTWLWGYKHTLLAINELKEINVQVHNYFGEYGEGTEPSGDRGQEGSEGPVS